MAESSEMRLVRCPKCENLLSELSGYSVYQCGGCGAVLRGKREGCGSGSSLEKSDGEKIGEDSAKSENLLDKGIVDSSDTSDIKVKWNSGSSRYNNKMDSGNEHNGHGRQSKQSIDTDEKGLGKLIGREQEGLKSQIGHDYKFSGRMSDLQNGERVGMEGFRRKQRAHIEGERLFTSNYPLMGTSSSYSGFSYNHGEPWSNHKDVEAANRVQLLEEDRAELLRKLDELKDHLSQSSDKVNNPKEKGHLDDTMVPPDPYGGSGAWLPDRLSALHGTSRPFFGPGKDVVGPSKFNYHHDPFAYTNGHQMAMPNYHPSMHNPYLIPGYGDPFASQILRRDPRQIPQQEFHPYYPGRFVDTNHDSYDPYASNAMLHPPSCSCFNCYENKRRVPGPVPPTAFINSRLHATFTPPDHMLYRQEVLGAYGPNVCNSRSTTHPVNFCDRKPHTRWPDEFNSQMAGFIRSHFQKVALSSGSRHCRPIAGGSPFITCYNCFELLQLPKKAFVMMKSNLQNVRCGACSSEISLAVIDKKLIVSPHPEIKGISTNVDDSSNEVANSYVSHSHGHVKRNSVNFSSDDYSGYDFHSVDKEPVLNSSKSQEMPSFHSSSLSTSEGENCPEVMIATGEATDNNHEQTKASLSPPPAGSPLQEYFDYSNNNRAVNHRFEKGNRSSRSEQEKGKVDKITTRQNSLKEVVLATEMDVHDYSNTGASQDSSDVNREHDYLRPNKGGESFIGNIIKKSFRDFSRSHDQHQKCSVSINGQPLPDSVIKKAEKLAGPIQPGNYWYDFRAGFWGVMGGPCLGIIPPHIEEFDHPMPENCAGGNSGIFVNGRELHQKDLNLLAGRGLPTDRDRSYIIEISGRVLDEDTGEELDCLGKLAPTVQKVKHGYGMKIPRAAA